MEAQNDAIIGQLLPLLEAYDCIGMYVATETEVNLQPLLQQFIKIKTIAIPKCLPQHQLQFYHLQIDTKLIPNHFGILEPLEATMLAKEQLQVILVPLVGFDEQCHRMGHGAGYYDRYLADMKVLKIGVAFEEQKYSSLLVQPHDVDMDMIVTAKQVYKRM